MEENIDDKDKSNIRLWFYNFNVSLIAFIMVSSVLLISVFIPSLSLYWRKFFDFKKLSLYVKLVIALIPAIVFGFLLKKYIDAALGNLTDTVRLRVID